MVIDSSALISILLKEEDAARISAAIKQYSRPSNRRISTATLLETYIVIFSRAHQQGIEDLEVLRNTLGISAEPFQSNHLKIARDAYTRYGKASGHPAKLNFGDCFSYALAKQRNDLLLCKGDDFVKTDIRVVQY